MKGVFDISPSSGYDDELASRYHAPSRYRLLAEAISGDWVVFRETRRNGGREAYIGIGQVTAVRDDPADQRSFYADIANFMPFEPPVPFFGADGYHEEMLRQAPRRQVGVLLQGKSIRQISEADFARVALLGLQETLQPANAVRLHLDDGSLDQETREILHAPLQEQLREIRRIVLNKKIRAANFRRSVVDAYEDTCAFTRLRIVNGGGKSEVQAAHIWAVEDGGPDVVQNGLALSGTVHWLFDRGLVSLTDDYRILVSQNNSRFGRHLHSHFWAFPEGWPTR